MKVGRLGHRLDPFEAPAVTERRNPCPRRHNLGRIDFSHHDTRLGAALGENAAPRIDDQRMAESVAAVFVPATLCRGEAEPAVFERAGALQDVPMRLASLSGEGRRYGE